MLFSLPYGLDLQGDYTYSFPGTSILTCHLQKQLMDAKNVRLIMNPRKNLINTTKRNILMKNHLLFLLEKLCLLINSLIIFNSDSTEFSPFALTHNFDILDFYTIRYLAIPNRLYSNFVSNHWLKLCAYLIPFLFCVSQLSQCKQF